jgi:collagenase-like PrtC family protease
MYEQAHELSMNMELLAPAGSFEALEAALEAGAGAVYFGLKALNARRGARNFSQEEFVRAVETAHARGAKAYLTLNIDLTEREIGQAARMLELARQCRVDAVIVKDPAVLALRPLYPELAFHFSTQTCMTNSADVAAAKDLGAKRVVLARELTLSEIAAASGVAGVQTEVFVQGAMCFCVSGRCLLSSWVGGRSGNRGACTSPCRVPWSAGDIPMGTPLSMRDLAAVHRLDDLRQAGVAALKIEGRLKTPAWVGQAVGLYRRALEGGDRDQLLLEAGQLGAYTGRLLTCGYLDGEREELISMARGRVGDGGQGGETATGRSSETAKPPAEEERAAFDLHIAIEEKGIVCRCTCHGQTIEWTMPKTVVHRAYKAVSVKQALAGLEGQVIKGCKAGKLSTDQEDFLMVPRAVNALEDRLGSALHQINNAKEESDLIHIELPPTVLEATRHRPRCPDNNLTLHDRPDRARLGAAGLAGFVSRVRASGDADARPDGIIVEGLNGNGLARAVPASAGIGLIVALPAVLFEDDLPGLRDLLSACAAAGVTVEVNSWGGWKLAREAGLRMEAGPGLAVLNSLAARMLFEAGMGCVTLAMEADRRQWEELTGHCSCPCSLVVFGRPPLMTTRAQLPRDYHNRTLTDRRGVELIARAEGKLWTLRPPEPFDLRQAGNERIHVHHLVVDLVSSPDPAGEWLHGGGTRGKPFRFNYSRTLA